MNARALQLMRETAGSAKREGSGVSQGPGSDRVGKVLGWLIVAVPAAVLLVFTAWTASYKLGIPGGPLYAAAIATWVALLIWRRRRT